MYWEFKVRGAIQQEGEKVKGTSGTVIYMEKKRYIQLNLIISKQNLHNFD